MSIQIVEERLDTLLKAERAKVVLLTGRWGAGKTYQWKQALQRAAIIGNQPRYAYISLFGLTSLTEVRKRVAEETVAAMKLPGKPGTVGETIEEGSWQLKPLQIMKLLPVIPYLGKLEGLANELSFLAVRNAVICFDDLERGSAGLRIADIFGLASFLKEERNCRVVLISNQEKLNTQDKDDLLLYLEKVVDETLHFAPTPDEACWIALGEVPDLARSLLSERIKELRICNIRVINRLSNFAAEMAILLEGLHEQVLKEAIHSLTLIGAGRFLQTDGFPPIDYLMMLKDSWGHYFKNATKEDKETDEDRKRAAWDQQLERYGYTSTSPIDELIARAVQQGYFERTALINLAQQRSEQLEAAATAAEYHDAWHRFWHSLDGNGVELLRNLRQVTRIAIGVISPSDLQPAFEVFSQAGQPEIATELLELFIASNQHRPAVFEQVNGAFSDRFTGEFAKRLREECERHKTRPSIEEALDRIDFERGWSPDDIRVVGKADIGVIEKLLHNSEGRIFRSRLQTLLHIGKIQDATEDEKRVSEQTLELLKKLARDDPVIALRMRQYLPPETEGEK